MGQTKRFVALVRMGYPLESWPVLGVVGSPRSPTEGMPRLIFTVLTGDDMNWWAAVRFDLPPFGARTTLSFDLEGFISGPSLDAIVAEEVVDHFDSIEYRFDGLAPAGQRLAVRWNDGPWTMGGQSDEPLTAFPPSIGVRINNGGPADWDPMWGSLGPVSFYSSQVPEPTAGRLFLGAALAYILRSRRSRRPGVLAPL